MTIGCFFETYQRINFQRKVLMYQFTTNKGNKWKSASCFHKLKVYPLMYPKIMSENRGHWAPSKWPRTSGYAAFVVASTPLSNRSDSAVGEPSRTTATELCHAELGSASALYSAEIPKQVRNDRNKFGMTSFQNQAFNLLEPDQRINFQRKVLNVLVHNK